MISSGNETEPVPGAMPPRRRWPSLAAQVLIAFALGIGAGLFFGELIVPVGILGEIFIGLLQMTVLPYILISLIAGLGRLTAEEAKLLALQGGRFLVLFWLIGIAVVAAFGLAFPGWESATFFSSSLVERPESADLVSLYIPFNPFFALSNGIVPAVVVFGLAIGAALIGAPGKESFTADLDVLGGAIMRIAGFVARLAPIGVFALIAPAAGTLDVAALGRLQVYILTYVGAALLLSLFVVPALVGVFTPIGPRRMLSICRDALVTAFATGSLLIVIPLIAERVRELLGEAGIDDADAGSAVDLMVPINFNLPNLGKLLSLAFVPFAGWLAGSALTAEQYPLFLVSGLLSFFGEVVVALPFLLDLVRVPADMFELFLAVDVFTGRFGTLLAAVHTVALAVLTATAVAGRARLDLRKGLRYSGASLAGVVALFVGFRVFFDVAVPQDYEGYRAFVSMESAVAGAPLSERELEDVADDPGSLQRGRLDAVLSRGTLRVGYLSDSLPFVFRNDSNRIVGFEVDLARLFATELGVDLELVRLPREDVASRLSSGQVDMVAAGLLVTPERGRRVAFSRAYFDATLALIVPDHLRDRYDSFDELRALEQPRIAILDIPYYERAVSRSLPNAALVKVATPRDYFRAEAGEFDALLMSAEAGSAWTLVYPRYSVVVPQPATVSAPVAVALPRDAVELKAYMDAWLELQERAGVTDALFDHWILGEGAEADEPRWSLIRNVLGWVD